MTPDLPDKYDITVQICSHNRCQTLKKVMESLIDQTFDPSRFELVLVDDGSTDGTEAMVRSLEVPYHITYCKHTRNQGLSTARNTGLKAAQGKVILIIDDDVIADPHLLEEHWKTQQKYDKCVCNGWVNHVTKPERPAAPKFTMADISTSFFWTSNVSLKRRDIFEAGLFDEDIKEYGWDDQEMGLRLMAIGVKKHNNYKAIGFHVKRSPRRGDLERICRQAEAKGRTAVQYVKKHDRWRTRLATGIHIPRMAVYRFTKLANWMETLCLNRLNRPGLKADDELTGFDAWCVRQMSSLYYFGEIERLYKQG
ncbi:glycosyltransferase family 2 protein [bacterium]|nr:glycosyltransferase family 2 protein [bacterium]